MPRGKDVKVWNEDLANALKARQELAERTGSGQQYTWGTGYEAIVAVRKDIYCFSNGRVVNLPTKLSKTVMNLCMEIIRGSKTVYPDTYFENVGNGPYEKNWDNDPYLKQLKSRGGPYAILRAFDDAGVDTLTKDQITRAGQQYCDSQMEPNYMAGRPQGAWNSNKTLVKHGLLIVNGNRQYIDGVGFRSDKNKYTLTRDGQKFIDAMKRKFPHDFVARADPAAAIAASEGVHTGGLGTALPAFGSPLHGRFRGEVGIASPLTVARRAGRLGTQDVQELRFWVSVSRVGDEKVFSVGKDRRQNLHNTCDILESENSGLQLDHQSRGEARQRALHIRIVRKGSGSSSLGAQATGKRPAIDDPFQRSHLTKVVRKVPASVAAANAAESRRSRDQEVKKEKDDLKRAMNASMRYEARARTPPLGSSDEEIDGLDEAIQLSLAESERKPAGRQIREVPATTEAASLYAFSDDDDNGDDFRRAVQLSLQEAHSSSTSATATCAGTAGNRHDMLDRKPRAKRKLVFTSTEEHVVEMLSVDDDSDDGADMKLILSPKSPASSPASSQGCEGRPEVVCLDDSQEQEVIEIEESQESIVCIDESQASIVVLDSFETPHEPLKVPPHRLTLPQLTVLIDNRERNRNATPRELRMQLTRIVTTGTIHTMWPSSMPVCQVEESSLPTGDFVFEIDDEARVRLAVAVERKRVGDLVQRSVGGDHWKQFLRMQDSMQHSVFLVEHETRSATRFTPHGSQNLDGWSPFGTLIDNETSIFLFFARAILSSRSTKFIQTRDEQASLRAVGALGLMTALSTDPKLRESRQSASDGHNALKDQLIAGGIPWQLVRHASKFLHSLRYAKARYCECADDQCRARLLIPFLSEVAFGAIESTKEGWSDAIYRALVSDSFSSSSVKRQFEDHKQLVKDHGKFLCELHSGTLLDEAIGIAQEAPSNSSFAESSRRTVTIQLQEELSDLFPRPTGECFFELHATPCNPLGCKTRTVIMQTQDGCFTSDNLFVHMLPAKILVSSIKDSISCPGGNYLGVVKEIASSLNDDCNHHTMISGRDRRVFLLCGLAPALDAVAKQPGYRTEIRAMVDLVLAELMVGHDIVVVQAVRLSGDNEMILQQLALACFHYHLLPNKKKSESGQQ